MHTELADARCTAEYMLSSGAEEGLRAPSEGLVLDAQSSQIQHAQPKACSRQEPKKKVFELKPKALLRDAHRARRCKMHSRMHALVRSRRRRSSSSKRRSGMGCTQSLQIQDAQPKTCSRQEAEAEEEGLRARSEGLVWVAHRARRYKMHSRKTCPVEEKVFEIQGAKAMGTRRYKTHIRKHDPVRIFPPRLWLGASPWFGVSPFDRRKPNIGRLQSTFQVHVQQNRLGQDPRSR